LVIQASYKDEKTYAFYAGKDFTLNHICRSTWLLFYHIMGYFAIRVYNKLFNIHYVLLFQTKLLTTPKAVATFAEAPCPAAGLVAYGPKLCEPE